MYKAIKTFAGNKIAMKKGDVKEYIEKEIAEDLLRAGYIEEVKLEAKAVVEEVKEEIKKEVVEVKEVEKPKRTTTRKKK